MSQRWLDLLLEGMAAGGHVTWEHGDSGRHDTLLPVPASLSCRMPIALTSAQIRFRRGQAHDLRAMLQVGGKGISETLVAEVDGALEHHELIKVKVRASDRATREAALQALVERTASSLVHRIGHVAVLYRPHKDKPGIVIPAA